MGSDRSTCQVYFGVSTLIDASSSDSSKANEEKEEVSSQTEFIF